MKKKLAILAAIIVVVLIVAGFIVKGKRDFFVSYFKDVRTKYPNNESGNEAMIHYLNAHAENITQFDNKFANALRLKEFQNKPVPKDPVEAI